MSYYSKFLRYTFWINDWLNGSPIRKPYCDLKKFYSLSPGHARETQRHKLNNLLEYAVSNSSFYKSFNPISLANFPVVNKLILTKEYENIAIKPTLIPGQIGKLHIQSTSGSTGTPFRIPQDTLKRQRRIAELKYFGEIVGFKTHEPLIHLRTWNKWQCKTPKQIKQENIYPFDISIMGDRELSDLCDLVISTKAVCLRGYSSSFDILSQYILKNKIKLPSVQIIISGSEALQDDVRANIKQAIGCEIISQYANEECGILAQESIPTKSSDNIMYLNHADYIFECLKMESDEPVEYGELGRLVITDLHNYAFPLIRYDTGDVAIIQQPNKFSNGFPILHKLYGRRLDVCYSTDGTPLSPMIIGRILKHYREIVQWQFIQKNKNEYHLRVVSHDIQLNSTSDEIISLLKDKIGIDANIVIDRVEEIPTLASGKRKSVVNECNHV